MAIHRSNPTSHHHVTFAILLTKTTRCGVFRGPRLFRLGSQREGSRAATAAARIAAAELLDGLGRIIETTGDQQTFQQDEQVSQVVASNKHCKEDLHMERSKSEEAKG